MSLAPLTPRCGPSNRGSLHFGFKQDLLLQGIRSLPDLQSAWLLLLFCASPRCCHLLRSLPPVALLAFAEAHDAAVAACLAEAGPLPDHALRLAQLHFQQGGLNLRSAVALAPAAYWASWADTPPELHRQLPHFAAEPVGPTLRGVLQSQAALAAAGFDLPAWDAVILGAQAPPPMSQATTCPNPTRGAAGASGPVAAHLQTDRRPFCFPRLATTVPTCPELTFPSKPLRALSARTCQCRRPLDPLGDHRAACSRSGALRSRGCPLERAAARVCREAGARVTTNTLVRDLNVAVSRFDDRRTEVIANGLPFFF